MSNKIITVSRQFGSGGRTIGRMVAEKLGIPCYDQELIEKIAKESGLAEEYVEERGEHMPSSSWIANALAVRSVSGMINEDQLWSSQCKVIFDIADQGPCVIVGRCAAHIINVYGEKNVSIEKRINDKDKRRKAYYQLYTDSEWGAATNYDITLNSASVGFEKCVDIITDLYNSR